MSDVVLVSVRYALATGATALAVAIVQPSQPFLAVLAAYLLVARPFRGNDLAGCLLAVWSGVAAGLVLVALFPQQFWLLLPAFAVVIVLGLREVSRWTGPSGILLMAMGLCATLPAGIVYPREAVHAAWDHGANLTIGTLAVWTAFRLFAAPFSSPIPERREIALSQAGFVAAVSMSGIVKALQLSKAVMRNIRQNLFFAFIYNLLGVPVAAGILYPFFGLLLNPTIAGAAMSFSSLSVVSNALRLRSALK